MVFFLKPTYTLLCCTFVPRDKDFLRYGQNTWIINYELGGTQKPGSYTETQNLVNQELRFFWSLLEVAKIYNSSKNAHFWAGSSELKKCLTPQWTDDDVKFLRL